MFRECASLPVNIALTFSLSRLGKSHQDGWSKGRGSPMHWVWCSTADGDKVPVNLERVATMARMKTKNKEGAEVEVTSLFYGCVAQHGAGVHYANSQVLETP